jgi:hypothetical protein
MKYAILILIIFLLPMVLADAGEIELYKPNEIFGLSVHVTSNTQEVSNAECNIQIRNETYGVIVDDVMENLGGGWYNYTYSNTKTGMYYCRENCTWGWLYTAGTCDFIIQGDATMPIAVILAVIFVISIYFLVLINAFTTKQFTEHGLLKLLFLMVAYWILLLPVNIAIQYNDFNGGPINVSDGLTLLYQIIIYLNSFITVYFVLWFIVQVIKKMSGTK